MDSSKITGLLIVLVLAAGAYFLMNHPNSVKTPYQTAKLVTSSLFENYPFIQPIEMYRIVYQYNRGDIPSSATYFYVNITIPQDIVQKLDQYAQNYPNDPSLIPEVYAVQNDQINGKFTGFVQSYNVNILEKDQYGVPTKIQAVFRTADVPSTDNYIIVAFPTPYTDFFDKLPVTSISTVGQQIGNWTVIGVSGTYSKVDNLYNPSIYASTKGLSISFSGLCGPIFYYFIMSKPVNIPVNPAKPLYIWYDYRKAGGDTGIYLGIELVNQTGDHYTVIFYNGYKPANLLSSANCYAAMPNDNYFDAASLIRNYCTNYDWTKVTKIDKLYVGEGIHLGYSCVNALIYTYLYGFSIANDKYIQLLSS